MTNTVSDFHPVDPGSIPGIGNFFKNSTNFLYHPRLPKFCEKTGINSCYSTTLSKGEIIGSVASYSDSTLVQTEYWKKIFPNVFLSPFFWG